MNSINTPSIHYPSLLKRIQAIFIDFLIILAVFVLTSLLLGTEESSIGLKVGVFVFSVYLYEPVLVAFTGGTLGHRLLGLRVKNYHDQDRNISLLSAFGRVIVKGLLGWLSFITITFNPQKRGIHDIATGSIVRLK